jgi:hypothetical protein
MTLDTSISGSKGSGTYADTISGPVTVVDESGAWKVTSFTYDNQPLQYWPQTASQTVNGLHVVVGYVVSYGNVTAALVTLTQLTGSGSVQLLRCTVRSGTGGAAATDGTGDFTAPPTPTGVLRFSRIASDPTDLVLAFSSAGGQTDDFDLALS